MRKKTREGKGAVNNEMWNISGGKRRPCCGYGSEKVMSKGHYLQSLKRKYKFTYKQKNRRKQFLGRNKDKDKWNVSVGKRPPTVLPDLGEKKPRQKSKGQFVVGEYTTKTNYNQNKHEHNQIHDKHKHLPKVKRAICRWKRQSSAQE